MKHAIIKNIPKNPKEILDYAKSKSYNFWVDEKYTKDNPGFARKISKLSYEEALKFIQNNQPHWVFSFRNISALTLNEKDYWEFGGCSMNRNDYGDVFIWIQVDVDEGLKIIEKFNLEIDNY